MRAFRFVHHVLFIMFATFRVSSAQTVEIKLTWDEIIATTVGNATMVGKDDKIYFYKSTPFSCTDNCPLHFSGCPEGDPEWVCGGNLLLDLSLGNELSFRWVASLIDDKFISISGNDGRTRVEFRAHLEDCEEPYQRIEGTDIQFELDDAGLDSESQGQRYTYNAEDSFIIIGTCDDGCARECEIFTRMTFEPDANGVLDMKFKSLTFKTTYDPEKVGQGVRPYEWSTNSHMWIREPEDGAIELEDTPITTPATAPASDAPTSSGYSPHFSGAQLKLSIIWVCSFLYLLQM